MSEFRKNKKLTVDEKEIIIKYARENGLSSVKQKFNVWPETVRYWMNPKLREDIKTKQLKRHKEIKKSEEYIQRQKEYRATRSELGITSKKWREWYDNLDEHSRQLYKDNIKQHRLKNIDRYKKRSKEKYIENKISGVSRQRYNNDPIYKMKCNIREHVRQAIKYSNISKKHPSIKYLGCSVEEFKTYIESKFVDGMTWNNHSRGEDCWHLDHIRPLAHLKDITDDETLKKICYYTNYQPLWEKDNLSKQDKYEG